MKCSFHNLLQQLDDGEMWTAPGNWEIGSIEDPRPLFQYVQKRGGEAIAFWMGDEQQTQGIKVEPDLLKLPYEVCWFEGELDIGGQRAAMGALCTHAGEKLRAIIFAKGGATKKWSLVSFAEGYGVGKDSMNISRYPDRQDVVGGPCPGSFFMMWVGSFLSALNCVNVNQVCLQAPPKLNLKRQKNGRRPMFDSWTLEIDLVRNAQDCEELGGSHSSPRLHLRRGHARRLRSGGYCWVRACIVGDKSAGMIHKEYAAV